MTDFGLYVNGFCKLLICMTFLLASLSKVRDISAFATAIREFQLVPAKTSHILAYAIIYGEWLVCLLLLWTQTEAWAFLVAAVLLAVFSGALLATLRRELRISCNCFGTGGGPASYVEVYRNLFLTVICLVGLLASASTSLTVNALSTVDWLVLSFVAFSYTLVLKHLSDLRQFFHIQVKV